jgi:hypothetical protein
MYNDKYGAAGYPRAKNNSYKNKILRLITPRRMLLAAVSICLFLVLRSSFGSSQIVSHDLSTIGETLWVV